MDRNTQRNGAINLVALLAVTLAGAAVARYAHSATGYVALAYYSLGLLVAFVTWFQMRLEMRERNEKLEFDELNKAKASATLFTSADLESFPARRSREQFERIFVPVFTVLLFLLEVGAVWALLRWLPKAPPMADDHVAKGMAVYGVLALILFLLGKYSSNLARLEKQRLLRPGASFMLLGAVISGAVIAALAMALLEFPRIDFLLSRTLLVVLGLIAAETLIGLLLEVYRPRVKGQAARLLYESRLVGLLGQPGGIITTMAQALDYQFGFKVSETWFYQFMARRLPTLVLCQLGLLWMSTTVVIVEPQERALLESFGRPAGNRAELTPGLNFKLPWPIEKAYRYDTEVVQTINVGFVEGATVDHDGMPVAANERTLLWTRPHNAQEFNLLVATRSTTASTNNATPGEQSVPADLLSVGVPVHYLINDVKQWAYNHASPSNLLEKLATREVVRYLVSVNMTNVMAADRLKAADDLQRNIQQKADDALLGVKIVFVGLHDCHPPTKVADAYEAVIGASQMKETAMLTARGEEAAQVPAAEGRAFEIEARATAAAVRHVAREAATAGRFTNQLIAARAAPRVFMERAYLETLAGAVRPARKYVIITTNTSDVIQVNLEDKVRLDDIDQVILPTLDSEKREEKK
jgi:modulator of FtsH protease HflK